MKTTLDLPDLLMRRVKIRAASEGRKLKEIISDLLEKGLDAPPVATLPDDELPYAEHSGIRATHPRGIPSHD
jgi:plasmid stability protein